LNFPPLLDIERAIYQRSYYHFFKQAYAVLHPGESYSDNWHIKAFCDLLQAEAERIQRGETKDRDLIVNTPFRSAKSLIFSVMFNAWVWSIWPQAKFIGVSYSSALALELGVRTRDLINSEWYQERWGHQYQLAADTNQKGFYKTDKGGFRKSVGTGGQILGSGADFIVLDDAQDPQLAASATERQNTIDFYRHTLYSRLNQLDIGIRVNVQQRLHDEDLSGYLLKHNPTNYRHICVPAVLTDDLQPKAWASNYVDKLFWPDRFTYPVLQDYQATMGAMAYANQLMQKPMPAEGGMLKKQWFQVVTQQQFELLTRGTTPVWDFDLDTAYTAKAQNDPSAYLVSTLVDNVLYIRCAGEVRLEAPELLRFISKLAEENDYSEHSRLFIEPKASGKTIVQLIRSGTNLNVVEAPAPAVDKVTRVAAATPFVESLRVVLLRGSWNESFITQCTGFPNAPHDDMVDCLTQRIARLQAQPTKRENYVY